MADVGVRLFFFYLIRIVVFFNRYRSLDCCTVLLGKFFLQFLLLCCNRADTFLVTEFFLTTAIVMEVNFCFVCTVCNSVN